MHAKIFTYLVKMNKFYDAWKYEWKEKKTFLEFDKDNYCCKGETYSLNSNVSWCNLMLEIYILKYIFQWF